jgi:hypothetical protein
MEVQKFIVKAFRKSFYCKVSKLGEAVTLSFGGKNTYCISMSLNLKTPVEAYLDRVEYDEACVKDGSLVHKDGTIHMLKAALATLKYLFPDVKIITLIDDSHIYCEKGSKLFKLNLAYDYILKYNQTWYQNKFSAYLDEPYNRDFNESIKVFDKPITPFELVISAVPFLEKYKEIYTNSESPREFINILRREYGIQYCYEVGTWLSRYIMYLRINIFQDKWKIDTRSIEIGSDYSIQPTTDSIRGGGRSRTRKRVNFRIASHQYEGCVLGYYGDI